MSVYELAVLGSVTNGDRDRLSETLARMVADFGLTIGHDVVVRDGTTVADRDIRAAFAAAFFGGPGDTDHAVTQQIVSASAPIIPTVGPNETFADVIPPFLQGFNGLRRRADDPELIELATSLLECVGLLRQQRRVFVSYRRIESRAAAVQLHDLLSGRGFDVFLDTHDIRPGDVFQDALWHRLCDSDVMVVLDTPTYFDSKWTRQEFGRARAKEIHVLRVVWPDHTPSRITALADTIYLTQADLQAPDGPITAGAADNVVLTVENLRSRSIASRYKSVSGKLRAEAERVGARIEGIGAHRAMAVRLEDDRRIWAYPIVGVPTAELLHDVSEKARRAGQGETPVLVYDHVGIRDAWGAHLRWLDEHIRIVRAIKVHEAGWILSAWGE